MDVILLAFALVQSQPAQPAAEPVKICREGERVTGSHVRTGRRCMTQEQWDAEDQGRVRRPVTMEITGHQPDTLEPATRPQ